MITLHADQTQYARKFIAIDAMILYLIFATLNMFRRLSPTSRCQFPQQIQLGTFNWIPFQVFCSPIRTLYYLLKDRTKGFYRDFF